MYSYRLTQLMHVVYISGCMEQWSSVTLAGVTWQNLKYFHQQSLLTVRWQCCSQPTRLCVYPSMSPATPEQNQLDTIIAPLILLLFPNPPSPSALVLLILFSFSRFFCCHAYRFCNDRHVDGAACQFTSCAFKAEASCQVQRWNPYGIGSSGLG